MVQWPDPRAISVGFAFGHTQYENPASLTYDVVSPGDDPDDGDDPGPVLESVSWTRGRIGDAPETSPTSIDLSVRNTDGEFSPRNVSGPHYGELREGTPTRLFVDVGAGPQPVATAFALGFDTSREGPGVDPQAHVSALGLLNRVARDSAAVSRMRLAIGNPFVAFIYERYWPMEDLGGQFASALPDGSPFTSLDVDFASDATFAGSLPLPVFGPASSLQIPFGNPSAVDGNWDWIFFVKYANGPASLTMLADIQVTGGAVARITLQADATTAYLTVFDSAGATIDSDTSTTFRDLLFGGDFVLLNFELDGTGGAVEALVRPVGTLTGSIAMSATSGSITSGYPILATLPASASLDGASIGHMLLKVGNISDSWALVDELGGAGEDADARIGRLASNAGISTTFTVSATAVMGASTPQSVYRSMREAEDADGGVLYELRSGRLTYQALRFRYNLVPALTLAYGTENEPGNGSNILALDDGRDTYNMITVSAPDGSFAVAEKTDGPVGSDTTTGIGPRHVPVTRNLENADDLIQHAHWILAVHTTDKPRYLVTLDLHADPALAADWLATDIGSRIQITGAPAEDYGPDTIDLIVEGERGVIDAAQFTVTLFCEPYDPLQIAIVTDPADIQDVPRIGSATAIVAAGLRLPGTAGNYASTPDNAALDIVGDLDLRVDLTIDDWTPAADSTLVAKWTATGNQLSYLLNLTTTGTLVFVWSTLGTVASALSATSTASVPVATGRLAVRATIDVNNGAAGRTITFYTADTIAGPWTQLGAAVVQAGVTSIFAGTAILEVGSNAVGTSSLRASIVHAAQVLNGIAGAAVANPDFSAQATGVTSFADVAGRTWTVNGTAAIYAAPDSNDTAILVGTGAGGSWTVAAGDFPLDINLSGERIRLSAISAEPQVFTVSARSINSVVKSHSADDRVEVWQIARVGL